jgi:hypothetical protein
MAKLPKVDSEGLRQAAKAGHARVSSVVNIRKETDHDLVAVRNLRGNDAADLRDL